MQIQQISVTGLFGIFDHVIPLNMADRITIIHGPNGFGKTAMLRLLNGFFNSEYLILTTIPFERLDIVFDNDSRVEILKTYHELDSKKEINIILYSPNSVKNCFSIDIQKRERSLNYSGVLNQTRSSSRSSDNFQQLDIFSKVNIQNEPEWLINLKSNLSVRLIESQRLLNISPSLKYKKSLRVGFQASSMLPTVATYSNELARILRDKFTEYGVISQSLDRTFPTRLVQRQPSPTLTVEQLRDRLDRIELKRSSLIDVGLLDRDSSDNSEFPLQTPAIDENTKNILSVYVDDVEEKLIIFNELAKKLELLRRIINDKFTYKQITFDKKKGFIFKTLYSETLSPTDLSSGEQHELVLLYELLFKVEPKSLVLIDEPELSLHVGWQVNFLKDLQEVTKLADLDILMATHSPDIIQDRWDLTVELQGLKK
jgi:predicted ATP-binding protein involved in virulence